MHTAFGEVEWSTKPERTKHRHIPRHASPTVHCSSACFPTSHSVLACDDRQPLFHVLCQVHGASTRRPNDCQHISFIFLTELYYLMPHDQVFLYMISVVTQASLYLYIHKNLHVHIHAHYVHTCVHTYMQTYRHTCIHAYRHTCMHTDIHAQRQTDRQTDILRYRGTYIYKYIHMCAYL